MIYETVSIKVSNLHVAKIIMTIFPIVIPDLLQHMYNVYRMMGILANNLK